MIASKIAPSSVSCKMNFKIVISTARQDQNPDYKN